MLFRSLLSGRFLLKFLLFYSSLIFESLFFSSGSCSCLLFLPLCFLFLFLLFSSFCLLLLFLSSLCSFCLILPLPFIFYSLFLSLSCSFLLSPFGFCILFLSLILRFRFNSCRSNSIFYLFVAPVRIKIEVFESRCHIIGHFFFDFFFKLSYSSSSSLCSPFRFLSFSF